MSGTATIDGYDIVKNEDKVKERIGLLTGEFSRSLYWRITGRKNLEFYAKIKEIWKPKKRIDELIDFDGTLNNSKIPIHDPTLSPTKTMDQTIFSTRQAGNPLTRGYRVYYGESLQREEDMSKAFGYEETKDVPPDETIEVLNDMGVEDPEGRALEFGIDQSLIRRRKKVPGHAPEVLLHPACDAEVPQ